jgi:hypothetical protein
MIERATEAARRRLYAQRDRCLTDVPCRLNPCQCMRIAVVAAIEEMREPTDEMCDAATRSTSAWMNSKLQGVELRRLKHRIRWKAMINVALGEQ